ncbi:MAG: DUF5678 domain-containing protein [Thaumarchaeota archaeon]|nr:DUF5678 domain-containing protein [Nitrososphaerota archaeon]
MFSLFITERSARITDNISEVASELAKSYKHYTQPTRSKIRRKGKTPTGKASFTRGSHEAPKRKSGAAPEYSVYEGDRPIRRIELSEEESRRAFETEKRAFEEMLPILLHDPKYQGKYVAVVNGKIVDFDSDKISMVMRVYRKHGHRPIYADKVSEEKEYIEFPSPEQLV